MAQLKPYKGNFYLWDYVPSLPAAIIFALLFGLATAFIVWRLVRTRTLFSIPFAVGGVCKWPEAFVVGLLRACCCNGH